MKYSVTARVFSTKSNMNLQFSLRNRSPRVSWNDTIVFCLFMLILLSFLNNIKHTFLMEKQHWGKWKVILKVQSNPG